MLFLAEVDLEQQIIQLALRTVTAASVALLILVVLAWFTKDKLPKLKLPLFLMIAITMLGSTAILLGSTIYLNMNSDSKGPVHWHADIEFWSCGAELDLRDPRGFLSNKVGTATYHEHNDKRIHLEGVVVNKAKDASLGKFMDVAGGFITKDSVSIPLNDKQSERFARDDQIDGDGQYPENFSLATGDDDWIINSDQGVNLILRNGNYCSASDEKPAEVQVFVYSFDEATQTYSQRKLGSPTDYVIRDESVVPPADCIIVEFDKAKQTTDKLCKQYGVRDDERCVTFGVKEYSSDLCNIRETQRGGGL